MLVTAVAIATDIDKATRVVNAIFLVLANAIAGGAANASASASARASASVNISGNENEETTNRSRTNRQTFPHSIDGSMTPVIGEDTHNRLASCRARD